MVSPVDSGELNLVLECCWSLTWPVCWHCTMSAAIGIKPWSGSAGKLAAVVATLRVACIGGFVAKAIMMYGRMLAVASRFLSPR